MQSELAGVVYELTQERHRQYKLKAGVTLCCPCLEPEVLEPHGLQPDLILTPHLGTGGASLNWAMFVSREPYSTVLSPHLRLHKPLEYMFPSQLVRMPPMRHWATRISPAKPFMLCLSVVRCLVPHTLGCPSLAFLMA